MSGQDPSRRVKVALRAYQVATNPLDRLETSRRIREAAEDLEADAITEARASGISWRDIGSRYGLTKQGAQQRFRRDRHERSTSARKRQPGGQ